MPDDLISRLLAKIEEAEQRETLRVHYSPRVPSLVTRLCAASRKIVQRHSLRGKSILRNGEFIDHCAACQQPIPCPDLRDLAEGYYLTVDGQP